MFVLVIVQTGSEEEDTRENENNSNDYEK